MGEFVNKPKGRLYKNVQLPSPKLFDAVDHKDKIERVTNDIVAFTSNALRTDLSEKQERLESLVRSAVLLDIAYQHSRSLPARSAAKPAAAAIKRKTKALINEIFRHEGFLLDYVASTFQIGKRGSWAVQEFVQQAERLSAACDQEINFPIAGGAPSKQHALDITRYAIKIFEISSGEILPKTHGMDDARNVFNSDSVTIVFRIVNLINEDIHAHEVQTALRKTKSRTAKMLSETKTACDFDPL